MEAIFDQEGTTVAWLSDNGVVHDLEGNALAFVRADAVYTTTAIN